jgi:acyl carrier protein
VNLEALDMVHNEVLGDVATTLASIAGVDAAQVTPDKSLADLDIDSMTMLEVIVALEDRFGLLIPDDEWSRFSTIGDLVAHLQQAGVGTIS